MDRTTQGSVFPRLLNGLDFLGQDHGHHPHTEQIDFDVENGRRSTTTESGYTPPLPIFLKFVDVKWKIILKQKASWIRALVESKMEKEVVHGITGSVAPGELLALMGPSGSGKTTVLNLLGGRVPHSNATCKLSGNITYNNLPYNKSFKRRIGFVAQDDILYPHLTVRETFKYGALLRLPKAFSKADKLKRAEEVIEQLGLEGCIDTMVGDSFLRGISGGERRRVCIGLEILTDPSIMLLDEPTSGLDSTTALRIVLLLRKILQGRRTIVITVHQPSSRLFHKFDKLILLSEGHSIYYGKGTNAMNYFESIGFCPLIAMNPADFLLDLCSGIIDDMSYPASFSLQNVNAEQLNGNKDTSALESPASNDVRQYLVKSCEEIINSKERSKVIIMKDLQTYMKEKQEWSTTWWQQFVVLFARGVREHRHEYVSRLRILQVVAISLISGCVWWQSNIDTLVALQDQLGLIFYLTTFWGFIPLYTAVFVFPMERAMLAKERGSDVYRLSAYFMARSMGDMPLELILPTVSLLIIYFMTHLLMSPVAFFLSLLTLYLMVLTSQGLGLLAGAVLMDIQQATIFASVSITAVILTGGFFLQHIPYFIRWLKYFSFQYYAYNLLMRVQYPSHRVKALHATKVSESLRFPSKLGDGGREAIALLSMIVVYRMLAYFALRRMKA